MVGIDPKEKTQEFQPKPNQHTYELNKLSVNYHPSIFTEQPTKYFPPLSVEYDQESKPTSISFPGSAPIKITTTDQNINPKEEWRPIEKGNWSVRFNDQGGAGRLFNSLLELIFIIRKSQLLKLKEYELLQTDEKKKKNLLSKLISTSIDKIYQETYRDVINWFSVLSESEKPISCQSITLDTGEKIWFYRIGKFDATGKDRWQDILSTTRNILNECKIFNFPVPKELVFFNFLDFIQNPDYPGELISELKDIYCINGRMEKEESAILIINSGYLAANQHHQPEVRIYKDEFVRTSRHEIGHIIDPNLSSSWTSMKEGFAVMCENGFDFKECVRTLRDENQYKRIVTKGQLVSLFSSETEKRDDVPVAELYDVSGTFFCYVFDKLGVEKFKLFYKLLSGNTDDKNLIKVCHGNITESLKTAEKDNNEFDVDSFINDYLKQVNSF